MRKNRSLTLVAVSVALLMACNPGVETNFIEPQRLVTVSSFISPQDSLLTVYLYRAQPLGTVAPEESTIEKTATVEISDGTRAVRLVYQPGRFRYERPAAALLILPGKSYFLTVKTADGISLKSQCRVPSAVSDLRLDGVRQNQDFEFEATWTAPPGNAFAQVVFSTPNAAVSGPTLLGNIRLDLPGAQSMANSWLTDQQRSGKNTIGGRVVDVARIQPISLKMDVLNLEQPLHRYLTDYRDLANWNANTDGFIPTFREPKPVFSNVQGGTGIFAAYNRSARVLKIN